MRTVSAPRCEIDRDDLAERLACDEYQGCRARSHAHAGDQPTLAGEHGSGIAAGDIDRVQVAQAPVAHAEEYACAVVDQRRHRTGICRSAGHHVPVERRGQVGHLIGGQADAQQPRVTLGRACVADDDEARGVRGPQQRFRVPVAERDDPGVRLRVVRLDGPHRSHEGAAAALGSRRERDRRAVRRPCRRVHELVAVGQLAHGAGRDIEHVQLRAHRAEVAQAVGLVVGPVHDDRRGILRAGCGVHRRGEGDVTAVRAPHRRARAESERGEAPRLSSADVHQEHLRGIRRPVAGTRSACRRATTPARHRNHPASAGGARHRLRPATALWCAGPSRHPACARRRRCACRPARAPGRTAR